MVDPPHAPACLSAPARMDIEATLAEAVGLGQLRASDSDLATAATALRGHIESMLPTAEKHAATLWRGGTTWCSLRSRLDTIRHEIAQPAAPLTPLSAHVQVELLRRSCRWLLERYGPDAEDKGSC
ncbi:DUF6415 family natural product biosynthesis protein [Streptomyces sp. NPDC093109]|uniref:DUF6415 family natural product biosynthesis protein n=1 Tax=Streptomyces sp. NPDC093109 TaxID=3154977 RepID=UPI00344B0D74